MTQARVELRADSRQVRRATDDLRSLESRGQSTTATTRRMSSAFRALGGILATLGVARAVRGIVRATVEQERVTAQLNQTLRSTGRFSEEASQAMQQYASDLQRVTSFGDEAVISSQALLLTFTQIGGETFPRAQEAVLDVATAMGTDLRSAALQVGKALNDPILGLTALSRSGIQFSETQQQNIRDMVEMGDVAAAQRIILSELETQFGGSARAARNTLGGAIEALKNSFGDLLEGDASGDGVIGATEAINNLTETLNDPAVQAGFQNIVSGALAGVEALARLAGSINDISSRIGDAFFGADAIEYTQRQIEALEIELRTLDATLSAPGWYLRLFGDVDEIERERMAVINQLELLEMTRDQLWERMRNEPLEIDGEDAANSADKVAKALGDTSSASGDASSAGDELNESLDKVNQSLQDQIFKLREGEEAYELMIAARQAGVALDSKEADGIRELINLRNSLKQGIEEQTEAEREFQRVQAQFESLQGQLSSPAEQARMQYEARLDVIREAQEKEVDENADFEALRIAAKQEYEDRLTEIERGGVDDREALMRTEMALRQQQLQLTESVFGSIASAVEQAKGKESAAYKLAFAAQQAAAIAQAYINTESAAVAAMAPPPVGLGPVAGASYAQTIRSLGYASIGVMAGQALGEIASFDGGGFTGRGARSGGLDGRGGFAAIMHPNETVIDHTKGQGMMPNINFEMNVSNQSGASVESSGVAYDRAQGKYIVQMVVKDIKRSGRVAAALESSGTYRNRAK